MKTILILLFLVSNAWAETLYIHGDVFCKKCDANKCEDISCPEKKPQLPEKENCGKYWKDEIKTKECLQMNLIIEYLKEKEQ